MKYQMKALPIYLIAFLGFLFNNYINAQSDNLGLSGPYLGQEPPGSAAVLFAPDFISTIEGKEMCAAFTKDGKEFYFNAQYENSFSIFVTKEVKGKWTKPKPLLFSDQFTDRDFTISPDGNRIYFGSNRPATKGGEKLKSLDIYFIERANQSEPWSGPKSIGFPVNTNNGENYPCVAANGNLYYFSCRKDEGLGGCDIYMANFADGKYADPIFLGSDINSEKHDWDAYIAPDESYIVFSSLGREDTHGTMDLYISFKKEDGNWTQSKNMGLDVNSAFDEICPSVTLDGNYLFFTSRRRGNSDIYWVSAKIIEELRPENLK